MFICGSMPGPPCIPACLLGTVCTSAWVTGVAGSATDPLQSVQIWVLRDLMGWKQVAALGAHLIDAGRTPARPRACLSAMGSLHVLQVSQSHLA